MAGWQLLLAILLSCRTFFGLQIVPSQYARQGLSGKSNLWSVLAKIPTSSSNNACCGNTKNIHNKKRTKSGQSLKIIINKPSANPEENTDYQSILWEVIRHEAKSVSTEDLRAATLMANSILVQPSLESAIIDHIANLLENPFLSAPQIRDVCLDVVERNSSIVSAWALDLLAATINDHTLPNTASALLFNKGFHALVVYRVANSLWYSGRDALARYFQSLISRTFGSDIHPACSIGYGCYFSTGSDLVIGETASIGKDCYFSHGVTLGGTGKESGDRHPKVGDNVFFGAGATVLGNIKVGDNSIINAGSVVTKPVEAYTRIGGVPAKFIAMLDCEGCEESKGALSEAVYVSDNADYASEDMSFREFCDKYMYDLSALREVTSELPKSA